MLITVPIFSALLSAFEWKSWNSMGGVGMVRWCVCMCAHAFVIMYYIKLKKQLQMPDTFQSGKAIGICTRDRISPSSLSGDGRLYLICMKHN